MTELVGPQANAMLARAGLTREPSSDSLLGFDAGVELLEEAAEVTGRDDIGIQLAMHGVWADLGVLGYVLINSSTVGSAIANLRRYFVVQQRAGIFSLEISHKTAQLTYRLRLAPHEPARQHSLALLSMFVRLVREGTHDPKWAPAEVTLPGPKPSRPTTERAFFNAPIRYGGGAAGFAFPASTLRMPLVLADPGLLQVLVSHANDCVARLPPLVNDLLDEARRLIASMLSTSAITIEDVAHRLGSSVRSVQRHLRGEKLSFKQLVDQVRLAVARRHLADPTMSLTDAAFMLGYSDLSAFSRAFRRWTGTTALAYRRAQLSD